VYFPQNTSHILSFECRDSCNSSPCFQEFIKRLFATHHPIPIKSQLQIPSNQSSITQPLNAVKVKSKKNMLLILWQNLGNAIVKMWKNYSLASQTTGRFENSPPNYQPLDFDPPNYSFFSSKRPILLKYAYNIPAMCHFSIKI